MENNTTFWGYPVKGRNEYKAKIEAVQNELTVNKGKLRSLISQDKGLSTEAITIQGKIDDLEKALSDLRSKDITGVNTFADQSIDNRPDYVPPVPGFSLAELTGGRAPIVKNRKRLVSHKPGDTTIAQRVNEGEVSDPVEVLDLLDAVRTENEDHIFLCDSLNVPESVKNDEPQVMNAATSAVHKVHMVNGENAQAFALLEAAQEPVRVPYGSGILCREINKRISGNHKKNTVIITNVLRDNTLLIYYGDLQNDAERDMFARLRRSPYRNYTGRRYRSSQEREKILYIMALIPDSDACRIARRIELSLGNTVRMTLNPASEYEGYTYLKVYSRDASKANMLNILRQRIGVERVITFGSIPGQYDVYVHDDGGDSAVKTMKGLVEGQCLPGDV